MRDDERYGRSKEVNRPELIGQGLGLGLGLLCWGFKGVQEKIPSKEASTLQIGSVVLHQSTTPSLSHTIWPRWASRQFLTLPIVQTLLPVTFDYSLGSEAVVMRQLRRWKRLWRRSLTRSHAVFETNNLWLIWKCYLKYMYKKDLALTDNTQKKQFSCFKR